MMALGSGGANGSDARHKGGERCGGVEEGLLFWGARLVRESVCQHACDQRLDGGGPELLAEGGPDVVQVAVRHLDQLPPGTRKRHETV